MIPPNGNVWIRRIADDVMAFQLDESSFPVVASVFQTSPLSLDSGLYASRAACRRWRTALHSLVLTDKTKRHKESVIRCRNSALCRCVHLQAHTDKPTSV